MSCELVTFWKNILICKWNFKSSKFFYYTYHIFLKYFYPLFNSLFSSFLSLLCRTVQLNPSSRSSLALVSLMTNPCSPNCLQQRSWFQSKPSRCCCEMVYNLRKIRVTEQQFRLFVLSQLVCRDRGGFALSWVKRPSRSPLIFLRNNNH